MYASLGPTPVFCTSQWNVTQHVTIVKGVCRSSLEHVSQLQTITCHMYYLQSHTGEHAPS